MQILHGSVCRFGCVLFCEGEEGRGEGRGGGSVEIGLVLVACFSKTLINFPQTNVSNFFYPVRIRPLRPKGRLQIHDVNQSTSQDTK